jgi:hypothetical protein
VSSLEAKLARAILCRSDPHRVNFTQVCDMVDCCQRLCSALCTVMRVTYGRCAHATSRAELVHGVSVYDVRVHLKHVQASLGNIHEW